MSGEALLGSHSVGIDFSVAQKIVTEIMQVAYLGVQVGIVLGGGNLFRGTQLCNMARTPADQIGMLATLINALSLSQAFENQGIKASLLSSFACGSIAEPYSWRKALEELEQNRPVLFAGGTGNPYFTTDSAAALRALEIEADLLIKATKVDGVFDKDPIKYPDAIKYDRISYSDVLVKNLKVMDATAIALCRENRLPIRVVNLFSNDALKQAVMNEPIGTLVEES